MKAKWKLYDLRGDSDSSTSIRTIVGRITKGRWKKIQTWARAQMHQDFHCHHDYDCCGCICGVDVEITYKHNQLTILYTEKRNY